MRSLGLCVLGVLAAGGVASYAAPAAACGGFFCSQSQPVNQAAERIIFANNGDGTVTAVIQILYDGPSENFSWLLPISSVPQQGQDIAVASNLAFARLQAATNPQYNLTVDVEGTCRERDSGLDTGEEPADNDDGPAFAPEGEDSGVSVAASGVVGAFEWTALELDASLEDPAQAALDWLTENGYDVLPQSAELIGPYLESGMYLLALRLTKGATTGSIRPIVLTYTGETPSIPIKLTAVAANENMGVMTWMLSESRAVPMNYNALELNEARINWFNASSNYNDVVTAAADDSGGQGFVTEFAGASTGLGEVVWPSFEEQEWQEYRNRIYSSLQEVFDTTYNRYQDYDGFWDTVQAALFPMPGVEFEDFKLCPGCYASELNFSPTAYLDAIEEGVIQPVRLVQQLIDSHAYTTRLYSTLSAAEMTVDPVFVFNPDLPEVSNIHNARRTIECSEDVYFEDAPWRINLPQGGVVRGTADSVGTWPGDFDSQPANLRVLTLSTSGSGAVAADNSELINQMLEEYNDALPEPTVVTPAPPPSGNDDDDEPPAMGNMDENPNEPVAMSSGSGNGYCSLRAAGAVEGRSGLAWASALMALGLGLRRRAGSRRIYRS